MKEKQAKQKLTLKKETVSNLELGQMQVVKGGIGRYTLMSCQTVGPNCTSPQCCEPGWTQPVRLCEDW